MILMQVSLQALTFGSDATPSCTCFEMFYRYANSWRNAEGVLSRELIKAYGIRINILVTGQVGDYNYIINN